MKQGPVPSDEQLYKEAMDSVHQENLDRMERRIQKRMDLESLRWCIVAQKKYEMDGNAPGPLAEVNAHIGALRARLGLDQ